MENIKDQDIFSLWFLWQFYEMPAFLFLVWKNYIKFALNYFSLPILLRSFFAPWHKYNWRYPKTFDILGFFNTLISNVFSRIIGAIMRIMLIIVGLVFQIFVLMAGLIMFVSWLLIPFAAIGGIIFIFIF